MYRTNFTFTQHDSSYSYGIIFMCVCSWCTAQFSCSVDKPHVVYMLCICISRQHAYPHSMHGDLTLNWTEWCDFIKARTISFPVFLRSTNGSFYGFQRKVVSDTFFETCTDVGLLSDTIVTTVSKCGCHEYQWLMDWSRIALTRCACWRTAYLKVVIDSQVSDTPHHVLLPAFQQSTGYSIYLPRDVLVLVYVIGAIKHDPPANVVFDMSTAKVIPTHVGARMRDPQQIKPTPY